MGQFPVTLSWEGEQLELDAQAIQLRSDDYTYAEIAKAMGESISTAHMRVRRGYARLPGRKANEQKQADLRMLDDLERMVLQVLERPHVSVSNGKVVTVKVADADGQVHEIPVPDDSPILEAAMVLLKIQERRARSEGSDAPSRRSVEVVTKDFLTQAMERMNAEMETADAEAGLR